MTGFDRDGNLVLTYDVSVKHRVKYILSLGSGISAVSEFYKIAQAGISGAVKTEYLSWGFNVLVTLNGKSLLKLIEEHYPGTADRAKGKIDPDEEYVIDCYDMS